jgi:excisionase family DNA binding protein
VKNIPLKTLLITATLEDFAEIIAKSVELALCKCTQKSEAKEASKFLSIGETAELLKVTPQTIHRWRKAGVLKAHPFEGRTLFVQEEVVQAITKTNKRRYT